MQSSCDAVLSLQLYRNMQNTCTWFLSQPVSYLEVRERRGRSWRRASASSPTGPRWGGDYSISVHMWYNSVLETCLALLTKIINSLLAFFILACTQSVSPSMTPSNERGIGTSFSFSTQRESSPTTREAPNHAKSTRSLCRVGLFLGSHPRYSFLWFHRLRKNSQKKNIHSSDLSLFFSFSLCSPSIDRFILLHHDDDQAALLFFFAVVNESSSCGGGVHHRLRWKFPHWTRERAGVVWYVVAYKLMNVYVPTRH